MSPRSPHRERKLIPPVNDLPAAGAEAAELTEQEIFNSSILLSLVLVASLIPSARADDKSKPALPEALKLVKATIGDRKDVGLTLTLSSDVRASQNTPVTNPIATR
ncbi:MAG TPA: hypothetical protein VG326_03515 [Tepidisphaeraceae bacterium]|jgi:hypothetical protein|nr:hypothetical protein [Tepidisphaeraceae bacterium]